MVNNEKIMNAFNDTLVYLKELIEGKREYSFSYVWTHKETFQTHQEEMTPPWCLWGPLVSSIVMIVTSSSPFQLDAQFHPRVLWESHTPSQIRIPSLLPPSQAQLDLGVHSMEAFQHDREICDMQGNKKQLDAGRRALNRVMHGIRAAVCSLKLLWLHNESVSQIKIKILHNHTTHSFILIKI